MSEPLDHHYLPIFFLSRWAGHDGRVCRFSKPAGNEVKAKRVSLRGTAFERGLYEIRGLPPELAQTMEKDFMARLDASAAQALELLESGLPEKDWKSGPRSSWSRFMLTQMLRTPEDVAQLKSSVKQDWAKAVPELEEIYTARRSVTDPLTVGEYLKAQNPAEEDEFALSIARTLMDHPNIGQSLNNMHWQVLDVSNDDFSLLTSDRPIWMTLSITEEDAFISMPIGPRKLFTAAVNSSTQMRLRERSREQLVKEVNKLTTQHAVRFVYGLDDKALPFVQKHMASKRHSTLLERVAAKHGHEIVTAR
jgi:Protein of unknown function (DUF4238)